MRYINDMSPPVIVLTGILNPAILNPTWVAAHILGYEQGAVLNLYEAVYPLGDELRQLTVLDGIGWSVTNKRCEIFVTDLQPATLERAERFAMSIVQTLPHTPWGSLGVNLQFYLDGDADEILDSYPTKEDFEAAFTIGGQTQTVDLVISPNLTLNVQRNIGPGFAVYFNNHHHQVNAGNAEELLAGSVEAALERCRAIMTGFFDMDDEATRFLNPEQGEIAGGQ